MILDAEMSGARFGGPSFSLRNRIYRAVWGVVWLSLGSWTPPPLARWRRFLLRCFGARIGRGAAIGTGVRVWSPANLDIGEFVGIGRGVNLYSMAPIVIGKLAVISQGAHLCTGTHRIDDVHMQLYARTITIGANAWIAADAFVGPGVAIGEGAVLGARACAFKNLDDWTVSVGNPASIVRMRTRPPA